MEARIPEKHKKKGVYYAQTSDGIELPVIDVTHPSFFLSITETQWAYLFEEWQKFQKRRRGFIHRLIFRILSRRSILEQGFRNCAGTFLTGMNTYMVKLGGQNLGKGYSSIFDRQMAKGLWVLTMRMRLQNMARLMADGLSPILSLKPNLPLHLINIAGGPAMDSINALILISKQWLLGRKIVIHVLDGDREGPLFGERALKALMSEKAPLAGLDIKFDIIHYDWAKTDPLRELIERLASSDCLLAASSEGGLFDYGSDAEIVANLQALGTRVLVLAGSINRPKSGTRCSLRPREYQEFKIFVEKEGWIVERHLETPFNDQLCMSRSRCEPHFSSESLVSLI